MENKCKVYEDNSWKDKDLGLLSSTLVQDNTNISLYIENASLKWIKIILLLNCRFVNK